MDIRARIDAALAELRDWRDTHLPGVETELHRIRDLVEQMLGGKTADEAPEPPPPAYDAPADPPPLT